MIKEIKYLFYLICIFLFIFFISDYYFSDDFEKKSFRNLNNFKSNLDINSKDIPLVKNDTNNIILYNIDQIKKNKKKRKFWDLIN